MNTQETKVNQNRVVAMAHQMIVDKKAEEKEAVDDYQNDPALQQLIAELRRKNTSRVNTTAV